MVDVERASKHFLSESEISEVVFSFAFLLILTCHAEIFLLVLIEILVEATEPGRNDEILFVENPVEGHDETERLSVPESFV